MWLLLAPASQPPASQQPSASPEPVHGPTRGMSGPTRRPPPPRARVRADRNKPGGAE